MQVERRDDWDADGGGWVGDRVSGRERSSRQSARRAEQEEVEWDQHATDSGRSPILSYVYLKLKLTPPFLQRLDEKSFGISKLGVVSLLNVHRLIYRDSSVGWDIVTSHLLHVQHYTVAPAATRLQAADVLDQILVVAPRNLSTGGDDLQRRIQTQVLVALAAQAEPALRPQTSTDIEIRRMAFDTLIKILESNGHSFIAGWERIFHVLRTACPSALTYAPPSPGEDSPHGVALDRIDEDDAGDLLRPGTAGGTVSYFGSSDKSAKTPILVRTSFPSLQLICTDFLGALTIDELRDCIGTLAEFGKQADDVNVALTVRAFSFSSFTSSPRS